MQSTLDWTNDATAHSAEKVEANWQSGLLQMADGRLERAGYNFRMAIEFSGDGEEFIEGKKACQQQREEIA